MHVLQPATLRLQFHLRAGTAGQDAGHADEMHVCSKHHALWHCGTASWHLTVCVCPLPGIDAMLMIRTLPMQD